MIKTFEQLLEKCGGEKEIAYRLNRHQLTITRWKNMGIAAHNYSALRKEFGISFPELDAVNKSIKEGKGNEIRKLD